MARPRQYGTYMPLVKKKKVPVRQQPVYDPNAPPRPPDASFIQKVFPEYNDRSEPEWQKLLDARVKPYEQAVGKVRTQDLSQSEFQFERAAAANQGLSTAFLGMLTGGKTGPEAEQYAKENFGGQYLPAQAMSMATQHLSELTSDWNDRDWEISSQYQKAMAEVPGLREQMRESISKEDTDAYTRNFNIANLLLDEAWNVYNANAKQYNTDQQLKAAREALGLKGYDNRKDAVREAGQYTDDTGFIYKVRRTKDGSWESYPTKQKKPKGATAGNEIKWRNAALREAADLTKAYGIIYKAQKVNGQWTAVSTGKKKAGTGKGAKAGTVQEAEAALIKEIYGDREKYVGKPNPHPEDTVPPTPTTGGMSYAQAYQELLDYATSVLSPFGRSSTYVANWVRQRLANLYPGQSPAKNAKPRGG